MRSIEICAGAGGQALGLEMAGFKHAALVELDSEACETLRLNRPYWNILEMNVHNFSASQYADIDLLAGGVPCPPFSVAGRQLGSEDDRDLFPQALRLVKECMPKAVLLENVKGIFSPKFDNYRTQIIEQLEAYGYTCYWELLQARDYGVPQLRPRAVLVALQKTVAPFFAWPEKNLTLPRTVGQTLYEEMAKLGWEGSPAWAKGADQIAPTLVGGSKKHGGPDLGPTRAKLAWKKLGVDGRGIAENPPLPGFVGMPRLTVSMAALVQGFPNSWKFSGKKTSAYRQVGNAFPPPVAQAVGIKIREAIEYEKMQREEGSRGQSRIKRPAERVFS
ncbi:MAG: DNA cytosine methyltransferase [Eggerthellaceae bacterium]|nr:DNA cytosine methyltransferase [Eggerthellaceae bacterium]